jgi:hypothetical protein
LLGGTYADLKTADPVSELSIWLRACIIASPDLLRMLLTSGCSVAETYVEAPASTNVEGYKSGWNCLFFLVLHASRPRTSTEFEGLQVLLGAGADPSLRDAEGYTISDYVDDDKGSKFASYRRELWYTALRRAHIHLDHLMDPGREQSVPPVYSWRYTPVHCRALRYLESWSKDNIRKQVDKLLVEVPWSEEEAEALSHVQNSRVRMNE